MSNKHAAALETSKHHIAGEKNGCLTRCTYPPYDGHSYIKNGRDYIAGKPVETAWYNIDFSKKKDRARYNAEFGPGPRKQQWRDPRLHFDIWWLKAGRFGYLNFRCQWWPWPNRGHHIIPVGSVGSAFDLPQKQLLLKAKYNMNRGVNIIFLPMFPKHSRLFELPTHGMNEYHRDYNRKVSVKLKQIRQMLAQSGDEENESHPEITDDNAGNVATEFENFSRRMRLQIKNYGKTTSAGSINDCPVV